MGRGRPILMPQGQDLITIIEQHPDLSYPAIHKLYKWKGKPSSVKGALARAGYRRNKPRTNTGGGQLDIMSHDEFWGRVDVTMETVIMPKIMARAERSPMNRGNFHGIETTNTYLGVAD